MKKKSVITLIAMFAVVVVAAAVIGVLYNQGSVPMLSRAGVAVNDQGQLIYRDYWGEPQPGWHQVDGNSCYFRAEDAVMVSGWQEIEGSIYYFGENGAKMTGWLELEGVRYYLNENGNPVSGWQEVDGKSCYFHEDGSLAAGWLELEDGTYYLKADGTKRTGWMNIKQDRYYLDEEGKLITGWLENAGNTYYLNENGAMHYGWLELDGKRYYLKVSGALAYGEMELENKLYYFGEDGAALTGKQTVEGLLHYYREDGSRILGEELEQLVTQEYPFDESCEFIITRENPVDASWEVTLIEVEEGWAVDARCYSALKQMLADCRAAGITCAINSAYRSLDDQQQVWDNRVKKYMEEEEQTEEEAIRRVSMEVAKPGYSEHHLGLAVDIDGFDAHDWMAENGWRYGFIQRYPEGKTEFTGAIYEPWHFRYLGRDLAAAIFESEKCVEEYFDITHG